MQKTFHEEAAMPVIASDFCSVYGPVESWRYGRSLGIDPIGPISACSFNCVYCQLGEIEQPTDERQLFIPTAQILADLQAFAPWAVDVITLSGSGEPTLASNLDDILQRVKTLTQKPVGVLTNGSLLPDPQVRQALTIADQVAVKLDALSTAQLRRVNRPIAHVQLFQIWEGLQTFRQMYTGHLAIQTMVLAPWSDRDQANYIALMQELEPDEIQLNVPSRPRPLVHKLEARGNHSTARPYPTQQLKLVSADVLQEFSDRIQAATTIPVRLPAR